MLVSVLNLIYRGFSGVPFPAWQHREEGYD
jgi:hypothetical protein